MIHDLHDAELVALRIGQRQSTVTLDFSVDGGTTTSVSLSGVIDFRLTDLGKQNIVSRAIVLDGQNHDPLNLKRHIVWATSTCDGGTYLTSKSVHDFVMAAVEGDLKIFIIEPSNGAEAVFVCRNVTC